MGDREPIIRIMNINKSSKKRLICGVIPARYESVRFPGKPLALICGKPMIQYVYERCQRAVMLDQLIVATDDTRIYDTVTVFGGNAVMTSARHASGTDRIAEAVQAMDCDLVINIQGDEPLIDPSIIDGLASMMLNDSSIVMATPIVQGSSEDERDNPNIVKVVCDKNGFALYFSRSVIPFVRDKEPEKWYKHIGLYGYKKNFLVQFVKLPQSYLERAEKLEQLRALENGYRIKTLVTDYDGMGVDTPADLEEVEKRL